MTIVWAVLGYWLLLSAVTTACFCWLIRSKRVGFEVVKDRAPTIDDWLERRI